MAKKRTKKKSPQTQRRSTRKKQRSEKGSEHDEYMQNNSESSPNTAIKTGKKDVPEETPIRCSTTVSPSQENVMSTGEKLGPRNLSTPLVSAVSKITEEISEIPSGVKETLVSTETTDDDITVYSTPKNLTQHGKHLATTPVGVAQQHCQSLKRELEMAMPLDNTRRTQRSLSLGSFPMSVVGVDHNYVKEIHFENVSHTDSENPCQMLCNFYDLHQFQDIDHVFSSRTVVHPDLFWKKQDPKLCQSHTNTDMKDKDNDNNQEGTTPHDEIVQTEVEAVITKPMVNEMEEPIRERNAAAPVITGKQKNADIRMQKLE